MLPWQAWLASMGDLRDADKAVGVDSQERRKRKKRGEHRETTMGRWGGGGSTPGLRAESQQPTYLRRVEDKAVMTSHLVSPIQKDEVNHSTDLEEKKGEEEVTTRQGNNSSPSPEVKSEI